MGVVGYYCCWLLFLFAGLSQVVLDALWELLVIIIIVLFTFYLLVYLRLFGHQRFCQGSAVRAFL